jgi:hypothetical protein
MGRTRFDTHWPYRLCYRPPTGSHRGPREGSRAGTPMPRILIILTHIPWAWLAALMQLSTAAPNSNDILCLSMTAVVVGAPM